MARPALRRDENMERQSVRQQLQDKLNQSIRMLAHHEKQAKQLREDIDEIKELLK